jgi:hypothetical protein
MSGMDRHPRGEKHAILLVWIWTAGIQARPPTLSGNQPKLLRCQGPPQFP